MKTVLKIFAGLILLFIIAAFITPMFVSNDKIKQELIAQVEAATGRTFTIGGDFRVRFFPSAGVTAKDVSLSGLSKDNPLVALKSLDVNVAIMPLFKKKLIIQKFELDTPNINLEVDASGKPNWVFQTNGTSTAAKEETKSKSPSKADLSGLILSDVSIKNGNVTYRDARTKEQWALSDLDVSVAMKDINAPLSFKSGAKWQQKAINISGDMKCDSSKCQFNNAELGIDKLQAKGEIHVEYAKTVPFVSLDLKTDELDLNPFLPPEDKKVAHSELVSEAHAAAGWSRQSIDFSGLKAINATATIGADRIIVRKIHMEDTTLRARLQDGKLHGVINDAKFYGGKATMSFDVDAGSNITKYVALSGIDAEPFLKDAANNDRLSGKANMQINVSGHGSSEYDIINSLNGSGELKFLNGAIKGINLADMVRNIQSAYKDVDKGSQKTDFAELGGTFIITNGIVKNNDLAMKAPLMRVSGEGQVDLPQRLIHYRIKPEIVQTIQGQGGKEKEGFGVPVIIGGTLDNPTFQPDLQAVVQDAIKDPEKLKNTVKDVKEQFKGENKKEAIKNLKGLLR
jgi:uncharacterized protein involved in outer membrane biogenesis